MPFALENLGCVGNETRLVDCPVFGSETDVQDDIPFPYQTYEYSNPLSCDPYCGQFARVACGKGNSARDAPPISHCIAQLDLFISTARAFYLSMPCGPSSGSVTGHGFHQPLTFLKSLCTSASYSCDFPQADSECSASVLLELCDSLGYII